MKIRIHQVDTFTETPFQGNPAAVCLLPEEVEDGWMQNVAQEMNLSETAFLRPEREGYRLRWFTPKVEVDLCGHATLASAHILWEESLLAQGERARFMTRSGILTAGCKGNWIEMDFPAEAEQKKEEKKTVEIALGVKTKYLGENRFDYLAEVESEDVVKNIQPDFQALAKLPVRGIIVTAASSSDEYDFVSRFFAPRAGIPEDLVTGSSHCCLGPYWMRKLNRNEFTAYQASSRGGVIRVRVDEDRVFLGGQAVTVLRGDLFL
ncbi:MAG: PhzF family phenazine biosynthesis isomerase [Candidatus Aminicenantes bacterium]|nr:PhzF family phenazine biosynthesis isomerase [Candidatus Aminicenantes bacterium]